MEKRLSSIFLILVITFCSLTMPVIAAGTLTLSTSSAAAGDEVTASGISAPDTWVAVKVLNSNGDIVFYDNVKSDMSGAYNCTFKVPNNAVGSLKVVAGYGSNVVSESLNVTQQPANPATYTVIFKDWDGSILKTETVNEGKGATAPANPNRTGYTFIGWDKAFSNVTLDLTVTAQYSLNKSSGEGRKRSTSLTLPAYNAAVSGTDISSNTLAIAIDQNRGIAALSIDSLQGNVLITVPSIPGVVAYTLGIPVTYLSLPDGKGTLTFSSNIGSVSLPAGMLSGVTEWEGKKAEITIGQGDKSGLPEATKAAIGSRPLIQLAVTIDGKQIEWNNPNAPVTISIPYVPTAEELENRESIVIWYIDGRGNAVSMPNGHYDHTTGTVTFTTTHFSYYAVGYNKMSFTDVPGSAWYSKAVGFIAARGITTGTGNSNYSPDSKLTRGDFLVLLMKAYDLVPDASPKDNFADSGNTYYTGYLATAKRLGISAGVGNNMFAPEKEITRQEMFILLYNALKVIGKLPQGDSGKTLSGFTDAGLIDSWAKEAMTLLIETGTIGGNAGKLTPMSTTTRAEISQALYNLLSK